MLMVSGRRDSNPRPLVVRSKPASLTGSPSSINNFRCSKRLSGVVTKLFNGLADAIPVVGIIIFERHFDIAVTQKLGGDGWANAGVGQLIAFAVTERVRPP